MRIILVHGMGRSPLSWAKLAWQLWRGGHQPRCFYYIAAIHHFDATVARLAQYIAQHVGSEPYIVVGHSLGGVLLRVALPQLPTPPIASFLLASPTVACRFAQRLKPYWLYRWATGEMGQRLADAAFMAALPVPENCQTFVGTAGPRWRWWPCGHEVNDGILAASETRLPAVETVFVPASHTFIMNQPEVAQAILAQARTTLGCFNN